METKLVKETGIGGPVKKLWLLLFSTYDLGLLKNHFYETSNKVIKVTFQKKKATLRYKFS